MMQPSKKMVYLSETPSPNQENQPLNAPSQERQQGIEDFLAILGRHKVAFFLPMVLVFSASVVLAWGLPEQFRSTATILIEQQEIPDTLVRSTITTYADERIQMITQRVLTTRNLQKIIQKFDLYPEVRKEHPIELVADRVRQNFNVGQITSNRGRTSGMIAFKISYESRSPAVAQAVATELTSLYLEENLKTRKESAADTTGFLQAEAERLSGEINELEARIATFKETHMGRLPSQLTLILQLMERTEQQIQQIEQRIRSLEDRKIYLEAAMAQIKSAAQGTPNQLATQIETLRAQLLGMLAVYTPNHPDIKRIQAEIAGLEAQTVNETELNKIKSELDERQAELTRALERYSAQHPDVKTLQRDVARLEIALEDAKSQADPTTANLPQSSNYLDLRAQHRSADKEIAVLQIERRQHLDKLAAYEKRVDEIPQIEREYSHLIRDRDNLVAKYQEIRSKMSTARVAENLERANKGERFSLIEPARRPAKPFKPNRKKIMALGLFGSVGAGLGTAIGSEFLNKAVHGASGVARVLGMPPLAVVPYIQSPGDRRRRVLKIAGLTFGLVILIAVGIAFIHIWIVPLDEIWAEVAVYYESISASLANWFNLHIKSLSSFEG